MLIFSSMRILANSMLAFFACKWALAVEESRELHKRQVTKSGTLDTMMREAVTSATSLGAENAEGL